MCWFLENDIKFYPPTFLQSHAGGTSFALKYSCGNGEVIKAFLFFGDSLVHLSAFKKGSFGFYSSRLGLVVFLISLVQVSTGTAQSH